MKKKVRNLLKKKTDFKTCMAIKLWCEWSTNQVQTGKFRLVRTPTDREQRDNMKYEIKITYM